MNSRYVHRHDCHGLRETWRFLDARFFAHIGAEHARVVARLEGALYRHFLVHAVQRGKPEKAPTTRSAPRLLAQRKQQWLRRCSGRRCIHDAVLPYVSSRLRGTC